MSNSLPPRRLWPIVLITLVVGLALVALWSRRSRPVAPGAETTTAAPASTTTTAPADPRAALTAALSLPQPAQRAQEFGRLFQLWLARDFEAALAFLRTMPRGNERSQALMMALDALSRRDSDRTLALAGELATTREDRAIYSVLFARLAQENPVAARQRLALVPAGEARENAVRALADTWVRTNPTAALAWAQTLPEAADRNAALESTLNEMAAKDPLQAIELAQKSITGPGLERTVAHALQKLTATDPQAAAGLVSLLPAGEMQTLAAVDVARTLAGQDTPAALAWIATLPTGNVQILALNNVLEVWAAHDAAAAGRHVTAMTGPLQHTAAVHLAAVLANTDPRAAIAWAQALPGSQTRPVALANIANAWAQRDPAAATRWVMEQPADTFATLTEKTLAATLSYWMLQDAAAARAWLEAAPLPADAKARLRGKQ